MRDESLLGGQRSTVSVVSSMGEGKRGRGPTTRWTKPKRPLAH